MAVHQKEYTLTVNDFNNPAVATGKEAIGLLLMRLILLQPGADPLRPEMGVGIANYRYALNKLDELASRIQEQIITYLPEFQNATVEIKEIESDKVCNIEISIDDTVYVYDSAVAPVPIYLSDIQGN